MTNVFLIDGIRTPIGLYGGNLASVRSDDLAAPPITALGHRLGMSGARLAITALDQLVAGDGRLALCTMCIGVGQGIAVALEAIR